MEALTSTLKTLIANAKEQAAAADEAEVQHVFDALLAPKIPAAEAHVKYLAGRAKEIHTILEENDLGAEGEEVLLRRQVPSWRLEDHRQQRERLKSYTFDTQEKLMRALEQSHHLTLEDVRLRPGEIPAFAQWSPRVWNIYRGLAEYADEGAINEVIARLRGVTRDLTERLTLGRAEEGADHAA